jgi:hypothetical protein
LDEVAGFVLGHVRGQAQLDATYVFNARESSATGLDVGRVGGSHVHDRWNGEAMPDVRVALDDGVDAWVGQPGMEQHPTGERYRAGWRGSRARPGRDRADDDRAEGVDDDEVLVFATEAEAAGRGHHRVG